MRKQYLDLPCIISQQSSTRKIYYTHKDEELVSICPRKYVQIDKSVLRRGIKQWTGTTAALKSYKVLARQI